MGWEAIQKAIEASEGFDLNVLGARELRCRPTGLVDVLRDVDIRLEQR